MNNQVGIKVIVDIREALEALDNLSRRFEEIARRPGAVTDEINKASRTAESSVKNLGSAQAAALEGVSLPVSALRSNTAALKDTVLETAAAVSTGAVKAKANISELRREVGATAREVKNAGQVAREVSIVPDDGKGESSSLLSLNSILGIFSKRLLSYYASFYFVMRAVNGAIDSVNKGLRLSAAEEYFNAFVGGADKAESMMARLRAATMYSVNDLELMEHVTRLVSMGLADTEDEAAKVVRVAVLLGNKAKDVSARINDFTMLLANKSTRRLDNFGLSVSEVRKRLAELKSEFPEENEDRLFTMAVLEASEKRLDMLGEAAENAKTSFDRLGAAWENFAARIGKGIGEPLAPIADYLADILNYPVVMHDLGVKMFEDSVTARRSYSEYIGMAWKEAVPYGTESDIAAWLREYAAKLYKDASANRYAYEAAAQSIGMTYEEAVKTLEGVVLSPEKALRDIISGGNLKAYMLMSYIDPSGMRDILSIAKTFSDMGIVSEQEYYASMYGESRAAWVDLIRKKRGDMDWFDPEEIARKQKERSARIQWFYSGLMRDEWASERDKYRNRLIDMQEKLDEAQRKLDELLLEKPRTIKEAEDLAKRIDDARRAVDDYRESVAELGVEHEKTMKRIAFDYLEQRLAIDGLSEKEQEALLKIARGWGLITDETYDIMNLIDTLSKKYGDNPVRLVMEVGGWEKFKRELAEMSARGIVIPVTLDMKAFNGLTGAERARATESYISQRSITPMVQNNTFNVDISQEELDALIARTRRPR